MRFWKRWLGPPDIKDLKARGDVQSGPPDIKDLKARGDVRGLVGALKYKDRSVREDAIAALGDLQDPGGVPALIELVTDDAEDLRVWAARSLAMFGDQRAVPVLLGALHQPGDRELAVSSLRDLRPTEAVPQLARILKEERVKSFMSARFWTDVADALGAIGDSRGVEALLDWRSNRDALHYYWAGQDSLARQFPEKVGHALALGGQQVVPALASHVLESRGLEAALALTKLGWTPRTDEERLAYAFARGEWVEAAKVGPCALAPLLHELGFSLVDKRWVHGTVSFGHGDTDCKDTKKIIAIAKALEAIGDARAVEPLVQILSSELDGLWNSGHSSIRAATADALGRIGEPAIQPLVTMISEPDSWNDDRVEEATRALALCGTNGLEALGRILREHSGAHRRYEQLEHSGYANPDYKSSCKWGAVRIALVFCAGKDALPVLRAMLDDENETSRADAADLIAEIAERQPS